MFLSKKHNFKIPGYDTIRNDRSTGQRGSVAFLVKNGPVVNKEYRNVDFQIITDKVLAIDLEHFNNQNLNLATIHCPNETPHLSLFQTIDNLSDSVMFVRGFNSKLESFSCVKKNISRPMLKNIQKQLNLIYLNNDEHTHMNRANCSTDLLDMMPFTKPSKTRHPINFKHDDLGSDYLPIEVSIDDPPHKISFTNHTKYKFYQTNRKVFETTLEEVLGSRSFSELMSNGDLDKYADFIISAISTAVNKAILKSKSTQSESNPISDETIVLIKEKCRIRRQYSQNKDLH